MIAPGFMGDPEKLALTIKLNRIIFPYILLVGLAAYAMALLNSLKHFSIPAFAPCLLNISIIIFALAFGEGIKGLSLGVLVGGFLQLAVQIPVLYRKGFKLELFRKFRHPQAKVIGKLMVPRILSTCIYQLNNFVDSIFGSLAGIVGEGGVAGLYFAYRLILFPLGIFSTSLSQVILPTFSTQALEGNHENLKRTLFFGLRATFFVILPASIAFMVLSKPIIATIFEGGKFDKYSTQVTADILFFYSIGLFAYAATRIVQSCFFALKDTVTPTKVAALALVANVVFCVLFMFPLKLGGIALATSISGIASFFYLFYLLRKRLENFPLQELLVCFSRILAASMLMGVVCYFSGHTNFFFPENSLMRSLNLVITIIIGLVSYTGFCFLLRVKEMQDLWKWVLQRNK
jgi:putative peptidoglycan lipid II flippase